MNSVNEATLNFIRTHPREFMNFMENCRTSKFGGVGGFYCLYCNKHLSTGRIYFCGSPCSESFMDFHAADLVEMITSC